LPLFDVDRKTSSGTKMDKTKNINMKKIIKISILVFVVTGITVFSSCKKVLNNLADLNTNENQPLKASSPTLLTAAEFSGVMLDEGSFVASGDGDGFLGIFSQQFAGNHAEGINYNGYVLKHGDFQFLFNDAFVSSLMNLKQLINNANPNEQAYVGIAEILQAYQLGYLTSVYGDLPWTQALDVVKYPNPKYDAQVDIYTQVQNLLSQGVANLNAGANETVTGDIIYNGSINNWIAAAYLLKARYYNHFSKKDPQGSATSALLMVDSAKLAGLTSDAGDFVLPYDGLTGATTNPWVGMYSNGMLVANKTFLDNLIAVNDPRVNAFFDSLPSPTFGTSSVYGLGKVQSQNVGTGLYMIIGPSTTFGTATSSVRMATYPELLMIEAEAALRSGDPARAATAHNAAVQAHLSSLVTSPSDVAKIPAYVANYASETASTITLGKIMTEKHKIMFSITAESWMDVRRMNYQYPSWLSIPVLDETVTPAVPVASSFIQRLLYPQSELDKNGANVPPATIFDKLPILQ
jgi:hypothetical protein